MIPRPSFRSRPRARRLLFVTLLVVAFCALGAADVGHAQKRRRQQQRAPVKDETVRVTLLQVNDVYQISPVDKGRRGGLARVATLRGQIAAESPHTLYLLAGDTLAPSVASNIFKGRQMIAAWNATGLDIAVLGNHEFDFGDATLRERMRESKFTWLGSNVFERRSGRPFNGMPPFVVREFEGVKVGFFGLTTTDTAQSSSPGKGVEFRDPCLTARGVINALRARGVRTVVAVTHLTLAQDKRLARCAPGIDAIIGGHEHTVLTSLSGRTPIFKMGSDARNLGRIDLFVSKRTRALESMDWEIIPVTDEVKEEPRAASVVAGFEQQLSAELDKPVGRTSVALDARQETNRSRETNLGSYIADAYRRQTGAQVALLNGGSIRSNTTYGPGELSKRDVLSILPFENPVVKVEVTGAQIRAALEHGVSRVREEKEAGLFPQVSGLHFTYDGRRPAGRRVTEISIRINESENAPLDDKRIYTLAANTYVLGGGDGYTMFGGVKFLLTPEEAQVEPAVLMNTISEAGEIAPQTDGRIRREDQQP
ncbi:MAG TPA: 5'-nucleotidase C-terminal domain-containing protein [Pyrinomonadaceae bacterium]|jgi:5'-nucleotidase|nr:5'-nucleotidase C-terminal domain-containing protein [Pyrinomonadaceae bacterium]